MKQKTIFITTLLLSLGLFTHCSDEMAVERSIVINAPVAVIFDNVNTLKKNEAWSPWIASDPTMKVTYNDIPSGVGASSSWTSEDSGAGTQTITAVEPNKSITTNLDFQEQGTSQAFWKFEETPEGVKVTWSFKGKAEGLGDRIFAMFIDSILGEYYENGLAKLKEVSEKQS